MAAALLFTLPDSRLHAALNALDEGLAAASGSPDEQNTFKLSMVNALWGQSGYTFQPDFLDVLSKYYGAGMHTLDFIKNQEAARQAINQWVSQQTNQRIQDLIARGVITPNTRLVLTNAIYFKASWQKAFEKSRTTNGPFFVSNDSAVQVPMMHGSAMYGYAKENGVQVVELPYSNADFSMVIVMPDAGTFGQFEQTLDASKMAALINDLKQEEVDLTMPKFTFDDSFSLAKTLQGLGMTDAFTPGVADFSKIDGGKGQLFIQDVVHKAFIAVDEQGTEAAAATGVVAGITAMPADSAKVVIDHPFLFLIRNKQSGAILFIGRVVNPK
jgi:serpin B